MNDETARSLILRRLRDAASKGMRCPTNLQLRREVWEAKLKGVKNAMPAELAYEGLLRLEVYAHNWRVIEIDGMRTAESPIPGEPYKVIERKRQQPQLPPLAYEARR